MVNDKSGLRSGTLNAAMPKKSEAQCDLWVTAVLQMLVTAS